MRIFYALTGPPGCGKTTAILRIVNELKKRSIRVEGMYTQELREGGRRIGFIIKRITGGEGTLAHVRFREGPRLGRYVVNLRDLEAIGVSALVDGLKEAEVIVVDEVGPMELFSQRFREAVEQLISSDKNAIITVHYRSRDPLVIKVKKTAGKNLIILNRENRDQIPAIIVKNVVEAVGRR
ncbi:MAG: NTPase [Thaumarchaeota archaeon]|nr:NTPase [Nitrososphaerota archaeon]